MQKRNKALASLLAFSISFALPFQVFADSLKLEEGEQVRLKLLDTLSSGTNHAGDSVAFQVIDDITAPDGTVLIKAGTGAWGSVTNAEERGRMGEKGELSLAISGTKAVDGKKVALRASLNRDGKGKLGSVIALSLIVTPLFLLMRGKDAKIPAGSQLTAYIDREQFVEVQSLSKASPNSNDVSATVNGQIAKPQTQSQLTQPALDPSQNNLKALEQLYKQGILTQKEFESKKKA